MQADLLLLIGQNPGTDHPRMLTAPEKQNGGQIVAVNPLPEAAKDALKMNVQISTKLDRSRTFNAPTGEAQLTVNALDLLECPPGQLILQAMRSHDRFTTTIYGHNDRCRGIEKDRHVVFANPEDIVEPGLEGGRLVDVPGEHVDGRDRVLRRFRLVSCPTARGCAAAAFRSSPARDDEAARRPRPSSGAYWPVAARPTLS